MKRDMFCRVGALLFVLITAVFWFADPVFSKDPTVQSLWRAVIVRVFGSAVFLFVLLFLRFHIWQKPQKGWWTAVIPAFVIAINNLPAFALISGRANVERAGIMWLFALEMLFIGVFEELAFRGVLLPLLLEKYGRTRRGVRLTVVISSALFGLIHLVNLIEGAGFGATVLQVGYSFLIGGMCAVVLLKTGNLLFCILIHATYDFCGGLVPTLGSGTLWDVPTVILTVILSVAVGVWMLFLLFQLNPEPIRNIYNHDKNKKGDCL